MQIAGNTSELLLLATVANCLVLNQIHQNWSDCLILHVWRHFCPAACSRACRRYSFMVVTFWMFIQLKNQGQKGINFVYLGRLGPSDLAGPKWMRRQKAVNELEGEKKVRNPFQCSEANSSVQLNKSQFRRISSKLQQLNVDTREEIYHQRLLFCPQQTPLFHIEKARVVIGSYW